MSSLKCCFGEKENRKYSKELVGIQIGLELLGDMESIKNRTVHIRTDCRPSIKTAFGGQIPRSKNLIEILLYIKNSISKINENGNEINAHRGSIYIKFFILRMCT